MGDAMEASTKTNSTRTMRGTSGSLAKPLIRRTTSGSRRKASPKLTASGFDAYLLNTG
jgi:hypothetical protein